MAAKSKMTVMSEGGREAVLEEGQDGGAIGDRAVGKARKGSKAEIFKARAGAPANAP
jgi:hypothetical protein